MNNSKNDIAKFIRNQPYGDYLPINDQDICCRLRESHNNRFCKLVLLNHQVKVPPIGWMEDANFLPHSAYHMTNNRSLPLGSWLLIPA